MKSLLIACGVAALGLGSASATAAATPTLYAQAGPGRTLFLRDARGKTVTSIRSGTYRIVVRDRTRTDGFRLQGPDPSLVRQTRARFVGTLTWTLRMPAGLFRYSLRGQPAIGRNFRVS